MLSRPSVLARSDATTIIRDDRSVATTRPPGRTARAAARAGYPAPHATSRTREPARHGAAWRIQAVSGAKLRSVQSNQAAHPAATPSQYFRCRSLTCAVSVGRLRSGRQSKLDRTRQQIVEPEATVRKEFCGRSVVLVSPLCQTRGIIRQRADEEHGRSKGLLEQSPGMGGTECRQLKGGSFENEIADTLVEVLPHAFDVAPLEGRRWHGARHRRQIAEREPHEPRRQSIGSP